MLLAFFGFTNIVQSNAQAAYLALGRADIPAKLNCSARGRADRRTDSADAQYGVVGAAMLTS